MVPVRLANTIQIIKLLDNIYLHESRAAFFSILHKNNIYIVVSKIINGQLRLYPSLPGVEGAQGISAGGPEARLAASTEKQLAWILPSAQVRTSCSGSGYDGGVPTDNCRFCGIQAIQ